MTFAILLGGIDLSVGSVLALATIIAVSVGQRFSWWFWAAWQ
jgi:ribose/xylose/arabinose/galactoside ABC-type transport system permease subunit